VIGVFGELALGHLGFGPCLHGHHTIPLECDAGGGAAISKLGVIVKGVCIVPHGLIHRAEVVHLFSLAFNSARGSLVEPLVGLPFYF